MSLDAEDLKVFRKMADAVERIAQSLGSSVPPGSESALREIVHRFRPAGEFVSVDTCLECGMTSTNPIHFRPSVGGPPTLDIAAQLDSNKKDPDNLAASVPPGSETKCAGERPWEPIGGKTERHAFVIPPATRCEECCAGEEHPIYSAGGLPTGDPAAQLDSNKNDRIRDLLEALKEVPAWFEEWNIEIGTAEETLLSRVNAAIMRTEAAQPAGGPPTGDPAAQLDSKYNPFDWKAPTPEDWTGKTQRIGVYDYDSLVNCLKTNYQLVFPGEDWVDPQNMIQLMAAHIQELRKRLEGIRAV